MNLYLDDIRTPPPEWTVVRFVEECIQILKSGEVTSLSLDHDLGYTDPEHNGYEVLLWLEQQAAGGNTDVVPDDIRIHSSNAGARKKMTQAIQSIHRFKALC